MSDISRITRKFERMMGHTHDELMEIGRYPTPRMDPSEMKTIAHITYDFENKKIKYTPNLKYRVITSFNRFYSNISSYFTHKKDNSQ